MGKSPDVICVQEIWLCHKISFKMPGCKVVRKDRKEKTEKRRRMCNFFINETFIYKKLYSKN